MIQSSARRRFLHAAAAVGGGLIGGACLPAAHAATTGRALIGFQLPPPAILLIEAVLAGLRDLYQPDLGAKPVVIPGGSGALALDAVLKAPADGGTVLILPSGLLTLLPLTRELPDEPTHRLQPVAGIGELCLAFVVGPAVPASVGTVSEYIEWVRLNPKFAAYGIPGLATAPYFVGREMSRNAGVPLKAIAYKGMQAMVADITSGAIAAGVTVTPAAGPDSDAAGIRVLAVTSDRRWPSHPDVPTMVEAGLMAASAVESLGIFVATGTPEWKIAELATAVRTVTETPAMRQLLVRVNMRPMPTTKYATLLDQERSTWIELAKRADGTGRS